MVCERVFTARGRVYAFIPRTELVYVTTTSSASPLLRAAGGFVTVPRRGRKVTVSYAALPVTARPRRPLAGGAAVTWSVCQPTAVFTCSFSWFCGLRRCSPAGAGSRGLGLLLLVLSQLLPGLLQLLLQHEDGALHAFYFFVKLNDEVVQFCAKESQTYFNISDWLQHFITVAKQNSKTTVLVSKTAIQELVFFRETGCLIEYTKIHISIST